MWSMLIDQAPSWLALVTAAVAVVVALRKEGRESRASDVAEGKGRLELAEMIETAAERQVAKITAKMDQISAQNADLSERLSVAERRIASLEGDLSILALDHGRVIDWWDAGATPPAPTPSDRSREIVGRHRRH